MEVSKMENEVKVKSLYKAIKILECFSEKKPELGITEISQQVGLYKSNVHNIISTFEALGYVESNPDNGKYRLGTKILELAHVISSNISFRRIVLPYMHEIANQTNETVYLGIPNEETFYIWTLPIPIVLLREEQCWELRLRCIVLQLANRCWHTITRKTL